MGQMEIRREEEIRLCLMVGYVFDFRHFRRQKLPFHHWSSPLYH